MPAYQGYRELSPILIEGPQFGYGRLTARKMSRPDGSLCIIKSFRVTADALQESVEAEAEMVRVYGAWLCQKQVVEAGGANLVRILRLEREPPDALGDHEVWCEQPWYAQSLRQTVQVKFPLRHEHLLHLLRGMVSGVRQLRAGGPQVNGRSHGWLRLDFVLLGTEGQKQVDYTKSPVLLSDPSPRIDPTQQATDEARDLRSLGEILYQLVHQTEERRFQRGALEPSTAWDRVGKKQGEYWRSTCSRLLNQGAPGQGPWSLEELENSLKAHVSERPWWEKVLNLLRQTAAAIGQAIATATRHALPAIRRVVPVIRRAAISALALARSINAWLSTQGGLLKRLGLPLGAVASLVALALTAWLTSPWHVSIRFQSPEPGEPAVLTAKAWGLGAVRYEWVRRVDGSEFPVSTDQTYTTTNTGTYYVRVTGKRAVESHTAYVEVKPLEPPGGVEISGTTELKAGERLELEARLKTIPAKLVYQWRHQGVNLSGATGSAYSKQSAETQDAGYYEVVVTNKAGTSKSEPITVTITPNLPTLKPIERVEVRSATNLTVKEGATVTLEVKVVGPEPAIQWYFNNNPKPGATSTSLVLPNVRKADAGTYFAQATNSASKSPADSGLIVLIVGIPPEIKQQPTDVAVEEGRSARFSVEISQNDDRPSFQWFRTTSRGTTPADGFTADRVSSTLTLRSVTSSDDGSSYSVRVTNSWGTISSKQATLTVTKVPHPPPILLGQVEWIKGPRSGVLGAPMVLGVHCANATRYEWYLVRGRQTNSVPNATDTYSFPADITSAGSYFVIGKNATSTSSPSAPARVTVVVSDHGMDFITVPERDFLVGKTAVTVGQYMNVMGALPRNFAYKQYQTNWPIVYVTADDAQSFCSKLGEPKTKGYSYGLPTANDWLFLAAGTNEPLTASTELKNVKQDLSKEYLGATTEFMPRAVTLGHADHYGLVDVIGNVREWSDNRQWLGWSFYDATNSDLKAVRAPDGVPTDVGFRVVLRPN